MVAEEHAPQEAVVAAGARGQQQHVVLAVHDVHVGLALAVVGLGIDAAAANAEGQHAVADGLGRDLELHGQEFAVGLQGGLLGGFQAVGLGRRIAAAGHRPRKQLHRDRAAGHFLGLDVTGHRVAIARIGLGRRGQVAHAGVGRLAVGTDADGEQGHAGVAGGLDGVFRTGPGVLPAVGQQHHARKRAVLLVEDELPQGLAQPGFGARRDQNLLPIDGLVGGRPGRLSRAAAAGRGRGAGRRQLGQGGNAGQLLVERATTTSCVAAASG